MEYQKMVLIPIEQYTHWKNSVKVKPDKADVQHENIEHDLGGSVDSQQFMKKSKRKPYRKITAKSRSAKIKSLDNNNNHNNNNNNNNDANNRKGTSVILKRPVKKEKSLNKLPIVQVNTTEGGVKKNVFPLGVLKGLWIKL
jgi:hypothetical protein